MKWSNCGLICEECEYFQKNCNGCFSVKGKTFWAKEMPDETCPLFQCAVNIKGFSSCGDCSELPCSLFLEFKDPNISEQQHQEMVKQRVHRLQQ